MKTSTSFRVKGSEGLPTSQHHVHRGGGAPAAAAGKHHHASSPHHDDGHNEANAGSPSTTQQQPRPFVPPLSFTTDLNPRNFTLILLQRLGNYGLSNLESAVRGCGARGISGDEFVDACLRCLAHSVLLPDACSYPWQRRCVVAGVGASEERSYESDPLVAAIGFLPSSITAHAGMNFVDPGDRYPFFSEGGAQIERRTAYLTRVVQEHKEKHAPLQSSIECFDQGGESLTYALTLLYHAMDVHNSNALSWEELSTFFSDVTTRGVARLGDVTIPTYNTFISREVQFPRMMRVVSSTGTSATAAGALLLSNATSGIGITEPPSISESIPPTITAAAYNAGNHRFAITTSGGAIALLDGYSFTLRDTVRPNHLGSRFGATTCMDYFHRVVPQHLRNTGAQVPASGNSSSGDGGGHGIIAVASSDCCIRLYDDTTHAELCSKPYGSAQTAMKYIPSLRSIVSGARSGLVSLLISRNHTRWQPQTFTTAFQDPVTDFAFQLRTSNVLASSSGGQIRSFDSDNGKQLSMYETTEPCDITSLDYSMHFDVVAFAGMRSSPSLLIPGSGFTPIVVQESDSAHLHPIRKVQFVPGAPQLLSFDVSGIVKVWDLRNLQCIQTIQTCRRVPEKLYAFPADDVAHSSKPLKGLMALHETSTMYQVPCHSLVFASNVGDRIAVLDGGGVQVLQPVSSMLSATDAIAQALAQEEEETSSSDDDEETNEGDVDKSVQKKKSAPKKPTSMAELLEHWKQISNLDALVSNGGSVRNKGRHRTNKGSTNQHNDPTTTTTTGGKHTSSSHAQGGRHRRTKECVYHLDVVSLPPWFSGSIQTPPKMSSSAGAAAKSFRPGSRDEEDDRDAALLEFHRAQEDLIVGHSETTLYLWRVSTGEAVLRVPLRDAYSKWAAENVAKMNAAREQKRRERELEELRFHPARTASGGPSSPGVGASVDGTSPVDSGPLHPPPMTSVASVLTSVMSLHALKTSLDQAARAAAHPRYFALHEPFTVLTIKSALFSWVTSPLPPNGPVSQKGPLTLSCGFDVGLEDGTLLHLPVTLTLHPPGGGAQTPSSFAQPIDSLKCMSSFSRITGSFSFTDNPPYTLLRDTHFRTLSMIEDMRAGAEAPAAAVTCVSGLKILESDTHPDWYKRGISAVDEMISAGLLNGREPSSTSTAVDTAGGVTSTAQYLGKNMRPPQVPHPWLLTGNVKKVESSVRVAAGATAILYLAAFQPPKESSIGLPEVPRGVLQSIQLTGSETGRPFTVSLWCSKNKSYPTIKERQRQQEEEEAKNIAAASNANHEDGEDGNNPLSLQRHTTDATASAARQTTVTTLETGDDIIVYVGMSNNVSLFYTVRLQKKTTTTVVETHPDGGATPTDISLGMSASLKLPNRPRSTSLSISQYLMSTISPTAASDGSELVICRVVRHRSMPDNASVLASFPITTSGLIVTSDSVGGVQLLYATPDQEHFPTCLSRFTAFQPADEEYSPVVVSASYTKHGLLALAAGSHVSIFSVQKNFKHCFPEDWAYRWADGPQELPVEANATPTLTSSVGSASVVVGVSKDAAKVLDDLKNQIAQQPPTPNLVRYFDVKSVCRQITSMTYIPSKQCLLIGGDDGNIHVFSLWGTPISLNSLPKRGVRISSQASSPRSIASEPSTPTPASSSPYQHKVRGGRHLSSLVRINDTGASIVYNSEGGVLGELEAQEDDVPYPWGQGKPLMMQRRHADQDLHSNSVLGRNQSSFFGGRAKSMRGLPGAGGSAAASFRKSISQAGSQQLQQPSSPSHSNARRSSEVPAPLMPSSLVPEDTQAMLQSASSFGDDSSIDEEHNDNGKGLGDADAPRLFDTQSPLSPTEGTMTTQPLHHDVMQPVHTLKHAAIISLQDGMRPHETSAVLVQPSATQVREAAAAAAGNKKHKKKPEDEHDYVGKTVDALQNQDVFEAFSHLDGEEKERHIMNALRERALKQERAKREVAIRLRHRGEDHATLMQLLRDDCAEALKEGEDSEFLDGEDPNVRQFVDLNLHNSQRAFGDDGVEFTSSVRRNTATSALGAPPRKRAVSIVERNVMMSLQPSSSATSVTSTMSSSKERGAHQKATTITVPPTAATGGEKELISFATAAGSLIRRFRGSRSRSLHAALDRLVGSEREMAGGLSVEAEVDVRVAADAIHDEETLALSRSRRRRESGATSLETSMMDDNKQPQSGGGYGGGQEPHSLLSFRFGSSATGMDNESSGLFGGVVSLTNHDNAATTTTTTATAAPVVADDDDGDTFMVSATSNRRHSNMSSRRSSVSSHHRDSLPSSSSNSVYDIDGTSSPRLQGVQSPRRGSLLGAAPSSPRASFTINKSDAMATRRKSVSLLSATDGNQSKHEGADSYTSSLRWSNLVADRRGMRRRSRASIVQLVQNDNGGGSSPTPGFTTVGDEDPASPFGSPRASSPLGGRGRRGPPTVSMSPIPSEEERDQQQSPSSHDGRSSCESSKTATAPNGQNLLDSRDSNNLSSFIPQWSMLIGGHEGGGQHSTMSLRSVTSGLPLVRALESVEDATRTRHVTPLLSRRLFHRAKASPLLYDDEASSVVQPRKTWDAMEDEQRDYNRQLSVLATSAGKKLYGTGGPTVSLRPSSAMSTASATSSMNTGSAAPPRPASSLQHNVVFGIASIQERMAKQQQRRKGNASRR